MSEPGAKPAVIPERYTQEHYSCKHAALRHAFSNMFVQKLIEEIGIIEGVNRMAIGAMERADAKVAKQAATIARQKNDFNLLIDLSNSRLKEIQEQAATVERLIEFTSHKPGCEYYNPPGCTCGLHALLTKQAPR